MGYFPKYTITTHLLRLLESIMSLKTKIELSTISVAWIPNLTKDAFSRTAHSSTAIEGNPLTLREVQIIADGGQLPHAKPRHVKEVINYLAALKYISDNKNVKSISTDSILKIHTIIGKDALDREPIGAFRNYQVYVGNHVPPKENEIPQLVDEILEWLNIKGKLLPAVFSSAILHYQFEFIHPFGDGNGRVGRVLALWELFRRDFDSHHVFSVDEVFFENRQRYYNALDKVRKENGDLTGWLEFVSEAIELTLERVLNRIESIKVSHKESIILTLNQEKLLSFLKSGPMSIREIQDQLKVSKPGAHFLLKSLITNKIVKRTGGYKTGKYILI